jgi:hypothetical protein
MSTPDSNGESAAPLAESFARDEILVEESYEQEIRLAIQALSYRVGEASRAGEHGLVRITLDDAESSDKVFDELREYLQRNQSPALGNYGRNRHVAIGALAKDDPDPKIWGRPASLIAALSAGHLAPAGSDPKIWGQPSKNQAAGRISHAWPSANEQPTRSNDDAGTGVVVGVLDTKISSHDYLVGGFIAAPSAIQTGRPGEPLGIATAHATFVAGLILQQAPAATVHVKQVLNHDGLCDSLALHDAIIDIAKEPISILNLSLGCNTSDDRPPFVLQRALRRFHERRPDAIVVAATGNHPDGKKFWPAALPAVVAVTIAGQDAEDGRWNEAAGYPEGPWVDVSAPGEGVVSTFLHGSYLRSDGRREAYDGWAVGSGTSFACAVAAGYLARNWTPGCNRAQLLRIAKHAPVPVTRSGGRLVLGVDNVLS